MRKEWYQLQKQKQKQNPAKETKRSKATKEKRKEKKRERPVADPVTPPLKPPHAREIHRRPVTVSTVGVAYPNGKRETGKERDPSLAQIHGQMMKKFGEFGCEFLSRELI